jgi:hypothetical protein
MHISSLVGLVWGAFFPADLTEVTLRLFMQKRNALSTLRKNSIDRRTMKRARLRLRSAGIAAGSSTEIPKAGPIKPITQYNYLFLNPDAARITLNISCDAFSL